MSTAELSVKAILSDLDKNGIRVWEDQGRLHYRAAKGSMTDEIMESLKQNKDEILSLLLNSKKEVPADYFNVQPDTGKRYEPFPLTDLQTAYLMGRSDAYELGNTACQVYIELECTELDPYRLNSAWNYLVQRHDMLRAVIQYDGTQRILEDVPPYAIKIEDLREKTVDGVDARIGHIRARMAQTSLPSDEWPLFEIAATVLSETRTRIHIRIDQLIADAYSIQILFSEWVRLYENPDIRLSPLEFSFRDYVIAEKRLIDSDEYARSRTYWLDRLDSLPPAPPLPLLQQKNILREPRFLRRSFDLDKKQWDALRKRSVSAGVTPSVVFIAAYAEVLALWSGKNNFTINLTVFNRHGFHPQVMELIGEITSTSLLEINRSKGDSFQERTKNINEQLWEDMDHLFFNGINVLRELSKKQGDSSNVVMPVVFTSTTSLEKADGEEHDFSRFGPMAYSITQTPQVWLDNQVTENNGLLSISWDALEDIFPEGLLDDMFHAYTSLIVNLAEKDEVWQKSSLVTLPDTQLECRTKINATGGTASEKTLYDLFEAQAFQRFKQSAIITSGHTVDYEELFNRSNYLGQYLYEQGAGPDKLVAIVMDKGWEQVVAAIGVLRSGAAYLPISSDSPPKRIRDLLRIGEVDMVLTQSWLDKTMEWPENLRRVSVDELPDRPDEKKFLPVNQDPRSLAYVIFTSGSTGFPKGVMIDNRGAVNTVLDVNNRFGISARDSVLALSNLSFDLSVYDIFGTLAAGGTIVMPDHGLAKDPAHWVSLIQREQVTIWNSVPASMGMAMEYVTGETADALKTLRLVLLSGDWIPLKLPGQIKSRISDVRIVSLGGATEASIWSVFFPVETVKTEWTSIPYGRPLANQSLHILNESMEECPDMVPGQLYIGGIGLALGYWRDQAKTDDSFIRHPAMGERLYRTGDLGRYLPDGNIQFMGREDLQVKINGHRIEPEEIETVLKKHPGVKSAVIIPAGDPRENRHLVAYVVPETAGISGGGRERKTDGSDDSIAWDSAQAAGAVPLPEGIDIETFSWFSGELNRLALGVVCNTLKSLDLFCVAGETHSAGDIIGAHAIQSRYRKLLERWLNVLAAEGLLERKDNQYSATCALPDYPVNDSWERLQSRELNDAEQSIIHYFKLCCDNLTGLLKGDADPLKLLFPEGSWQTAENLYQMNPVSKYFNSIVRGIVRSISGCRSQAKTFRIMEAGAGTGGTTGSILPVLKPDETMYLYTDVSNFFINKAKNKFDAFPFIQYKLFDINKRPRVQDFHTGGFDVIIAANVLHDAINVENTLGYLKSLLAPGGFLLISENTRNDPWQMVSVAFIEGLNDFMDERVKDNLPLLSVEKWCGQLSKAGFLNNTFFPAAGSPCEVFGQHVIMARAPQTENRLDQDELDRFLGRKLPPYMIPSFYMFLDSMPLTANGKVDRKAFSLPGDGIKPTVAKQYEAPRNALEKKLSAMWGELLGMENVGIDDDFFKLGGDSLLITQLLVKIRDTIDRDMDWEQTLKRIFEAPTVRGLSEFLGAEGNLRPAPFPVNNKKAGSPLVKMKSKGALQPFFLISDGRGNLLEYRELTACFEADRPLYGLEVNDIDRYLEGDSQIENMAAEYVRAIRDVQAEGPYALGGYCMGGIIALEMARQFQSMGQQVEHLIMISSYKPPFPIDDDILLFHMFARGLSVSLAGTDFGLTDSEFEKTVKIIVDRGLSSLDSALIRKISAENDETSFLQKYLLLEKLTPEDRLAFLFDRATSDNEDKLGNMNLTQFKRMFSIYKTSFMAVSRYEPIPYEGKITFMKPMEEVSPGVTEKGDELLVWPDIATRGCTVFDIPGNHQTCLEMPHAAVLAGQVEKILNRSDS